MAKDKQIKGIAYIADILRRKKPSVFTSKRLATSKAREIKNELKRLGKNVTIKNVLPLSKVNKSTKRKKFVPVLHKSFKEISNYFALADYPRLIQTKAKKNIWFRSKVSKSSLPLIQGGSQIEYEEYFKEFVDYVNSMTSMLDDNTRYEVDWFITTQKPIFENGIWVANIISCTIDGVEFLYGFAPEKPKPPQKAVVTEDEKKKKKKKQPIAEKPIKKKVEVDKKIQKEIELEQKKIELSKQLEKESKQREKESKQREKEKQTEANIREQEAQAKIARIKELKEMGFTTKEIMEILKG
jgi:hypothetical protein